MLGDVLAACTALGADLGRDRGRRREAGGARVRRDLVADPGGGQGAAVAAALAGPTSPCSSSTPTSRAPSPHDLRALLGGDAGGRPRARRRRRRHDERALARGARALRPALRPGQRGAVLRARGRASAATRCRRRSRTSRTTSTRWRTSHRLQFAARAAHAGRALALHRRRGVKDRSCSRAASAARASRGRCSRWSSRPTLTVVGNVGDDLEVLGLHVSPDLDTVLYTLAGLSDEERGWGREGETWNALDTVERARRRGLVPARRPRPRAAPRARAGPAPRASRSRRSRRGSPRRSASRRGSCPRPTTACARGSRRPPASFPFQDWFVARGHRDPVDGVRFEGAEDARPAPGVLEALARGRPDPARARATRTSASRRSSPCARSAPRSSARAAPASRSAR